MADEHDVWLANEHKRLAGVADEARKAFYSHVGAAKAILMVIERRAREKAEPAPADSKETETDE